MAISQSDIIELSPADYNISADNHQSPKRARLNVNYSIGPASELEKQFQNQQQQQQHHQVQIQGIKKIVKVQNVHDLQQLQQQLQQQQQIVVQTISTNSGNGQHQSSSSSNAQYTHIGTMSSLNDNQNRRKMQLVNRIA